ncbi:hypothetical protein Vretimale_605 [Volvox reticuliferus]|uniref:Uncharacterized protein n=1 Tax=Volvox reticuliferus TaxID=1737510 RepID=A0A8J4D606_9CHLO|nr:hypothetical protein Vretifemale_2386 [Volvox reticuliferus]GIL94392.1 hypothetical protein Vretimale_605 [Volvox reticuliferus]
MVGNEKIKKAERWLDSVAQLAPSVVASEFPTMAKASGSSALESLRCLSMLPVHAPDLTVSGTSCLDDQQPTCCRMPSEVKAVRYGAYLRRKTSSAVSNLYRLMELGLAKGADVLGPDILGPTNDSLCPRQAAQSRPPGMSPSASLTAGVRKRTASEASFGDPDSSDHFGPHSSGLCHAARTSENRSIPSVPAIRLRKGWCDGAVGSDATGEMLQSNAASVSRQSRQSDSATASDVVHDDSQEHHPAPGLRRPAATRPQFQNACNGQQSQRVAVVPPAEESARSFVGPASTSNAQLSPSEQVLWQDPVGPPVTSRGVGIPANGGTMAMAESGQRIASLGPSSQLQQKQLPPEQYDFGIVSKAELVTAACPQKNHGAAHMAGHWSHHTPQCICDLPAPASALEQLVCRREFTSAGLMIGNSAASRDQWAQQPCPSPLMPLALPEQQQQQQTISQAHADGSILGDLSSVNPRLWTALEASAAATAAHWRQQLSRLPVMDAVLKHWPLASFAQRLGENVMEHNAGIRSKYGTNMSSRTLTGDSGVGLMQLKHVLTPLPRRNAGVPVDQGRSVELKAGTALPLKALTTPLPADTCQARTELWDLIHLNVPFTIRPDDEQVPGRIVSVSTFGASGAKSAAGRNETLGALSEPRIGDGCDDGHPRGEDILLHSDVEPNQDDSDVYICREGLVCLASLASGESIRSGWRLPFLVRQWHAARNGDERTASCAAEPPEAPGCSCSAACCGWHGRMLRQTGQRPTLYFAEPLHDMPRLLLDSWARMCANALAVSGNDVRSHMVDSCCAVAGSSCVGVQRGDVLEDDCSCCQQDEFQLGGLSLLVLSHCDLGFLSGSGALTPVQLVALASPPMLSGGPARQQAAQAMGKVLEQRYIELACRSELLLGPDCTMVLFVDAADGTVLLQQRLDGGAVRHLAAGRSTGMKLHHHWQVVYDILDELRSLRPGPYVLYLNSSSKCLELLGAGEMPVRK